MRSQTYRVIRAAVLVGFLLLAARSAFAGVQNDYHATEAQATAHKDANVAAMLGANACNDGSTCSDLSYKELGFSSNYQGVTYIGRWNCRVERDYGTGTTVYACHSSSLGHDHSDGSQYHWFAEEAANCPDNGVDYPGGMQYPLNHPGTLCFNPCQVRPIGQAVCVNGVCLGQVEFTGEACQAGDPHTGTGSDGDGDGEDDDAPSGCSVSNGVLTCDCNANPSASFCNYDENDTPNCTTNANGTVTCVGQGDPDNPGDTGDPNNPQNPGTGNDGGGEDDSGDGSGHGDDEGGSATSSGDCTVQPTCSGSADQCATLVQVWRSSCELVNPQGQKPPWEDDPDYGRDLKTEAELVNVEGQLDASGIGGGDCPANPNISVLGTDIELDISAMCDVTGIIRVFVILMGWLTAAFIVYRAF